MIRVLLADDEPLVRVGVRAVLATDPAVDVVAEAANGREAVDLALAHRPDVALLDVQMPVLDGLDAADEIHRLVPGTGVVILTTFSEDAYIARALGGGASGFLLKAGDPRDLLAGVHAVAEGAACLSPRIARRVIAELGGGRLIRATTARARVAALTTRERTVLTLVAKGLSNAEIARRLHLVEGTVKAYMTSLMDRLSVRNRVQAAVLAHEAGLVED
ncbi:response regulator [Umezawaea tangerina]|uniref:LuxR family two component transcriptional regulator n=1 Tax=Umezawaea tangerina TaxID=84725 RepID=A0A2T0TA47_9PSEU|nr:response regulator transcription factor [Umezawaea tangerina]PRY42537.1 LuxR family two component transcriptional regulator [Umezawaea tangerina]